MLASQAQCVLRSYNALAREALSFDVCIMEYHSCAICRVYGRWSGLESIYSTCITGSGNLLSLVD